MPEFADWAWRCEVYGCNAQVFRSEPGPDWQAEQPYTPADPATLSEEWVMVADNDQVVAPGCEKRPVQLMKVWSFALNPVNPDVMYIGMFVEESGGLGHTAGVYKSVDGGETWFTAWAGLGGTSADSCWWCSAGVSVSELYVDPADSQVVYAATTERGSYRSTDGGAHWAEVFYSNGTYLAPGKVRRGGNGVLYHVVGSSLFKPSEDGSLWEHVGVVSWNRQVLDLVPDPVLPDRLWLAMGEPWNYDSGEGPILRSDDAGETWVETGHDLLGADDSGEHVLSLAICPSDPDQMAAAVTRGGIFLSGDGGETWSRADMPEDATGGHHVAYAPIPDKCLLYASERERPSTWWTDDGGATWGRLRLKVLEHLAFNPFVPQVVYGITLGGAGDSRSFELWTRCHDCQQ